MSKAIQRNSSLKRFVFEGMGLSREQIDAFFGGLVLSPTAHWPQLKEVSFEATPIERDSAQNDMIKFLQQAPNLETLNLKDTRLTTDQKRKILEQLQTSCPNLTAICD